MSIRAKTEYLTTRRAHVVPNEIIITSIAAARNDDLPHYLNVAAGIAAPVSGYGEPSIDGILQNSGVRASSVARLYVPAAVSAELKTSGRPLSKTQISAAYADRELSSSLSRTYRVVLETPANTEQLCRELCRRSKAIENARPNYIVESQRVPNDELYGFQWGLPAINAETAWDIEAGHPDVRVAIVDSGVDLDHDDLVAKLADGSDFVDYPYGPDGRYTPLGDFKNRDNFPDDEDGHGTHCAGVAAGGSDNSRGTAGVCWAGKIVPVRVMFRVHDRWQNVETSVGTTADIDAGIKFAVDAGAHVINLSLGGPEKTHQEVIQYAVDSGVAVFAATGNENTRDPSWPASDPNVLAVGAVNSGLGRAEFSNYGPAYNDFVVAPGVRIASTYRDNSYVYLQGTSMATPFVTGLGALIASLGLRAGKRLSPATIYEVIRKTAMPLGTGKGDLFVGQGLIDAKAALVEAQRRLNC